MPARWDFAIKQGETFEKTVLWNDSNGDPVNLVGASAGLLVKEAKSDDADDALAALTTSNGYITLGGVQGTIVLAIPRAITALLSFSHAYYDLEVILASGSAKFILEGIVNLVKQITDTTFTGEEVSSYLVPFRIGSGVLVAVFDYEKMQFPVDVTITKATVFSMTDATEDAQIDIRNAAGGGGSGISVTVSAGENEGSATGTLTVTTTQAVYPRCVKSGNLSNVNIKLWVTV